MEYIESVFYGKDNALLDTMFNFYKPEATRVVDVCCNSRKMWKGTKIGPCVIGYDIDPQWSPDQVCGWDNLPDSDKSVDVLVYDREPRS